MKSIQQIKKDLSAKRIAKKSLSKLKGGTTSTADTIIIPDDTDIT